MGLKANKGKSSTGRRGPASAAGSPVSAGAAVLAAPGREATDTRPQPLDGGLTMGESRDKRGGEQAELGNIGHGQGLRRWRCRIIAAEALARC